MATSLSYNFPQKFTVATLVEQAFWMLEIPPEKITPRDSKSATDIANLELAVWCSQNQILSLIQRTMMDLVQTQSFYKLPDHVVNVYECSLSNYDRLLFGSTGGPLGLSISNDGDASPCFNPIATSGLTQTAPDGWIGYDYVSVSPAVWYIGVRSLTTQQYTLAIEYSYDPISIPAANRQWITGYTVPTQLYVPNVTNWFIYESPPNAVSWRIREIKGATLAIQQIYFAQPSQTLNDQLLGTISSDQFMGLAQKYIPKSGSSGYYFNNSKTKSIYIYGSNFEQFTSVIYTAQVFAQDVDKLFQNIDLATKLFYPLAVAMALRLSLGYAPSKYPLLQQEFDRVVPTTLFTDREQVDITFEYNMSGMWSM